MAIKSQVKKQRRAQRVRTRIAREAVGRPRLSVYRSNCNMYAQIIDDIKGHTLAAASSQDKDFKGMVPTRTPRRPLASWWQNVPSRPA